MRAIKLVLCGVFALFTLSAIAQWLMAMPRLLNAISANSDAEAIGRLVGGPLIAIALGAITIWLWKSAMKRQPRPRTGAPPIPEPRGNNE
jgi:hypothetical protein